jgi:hypothetical protein
VFGNTNQDVPPSASTYTPNWRLSATVSIAESVNTIAARPHASGVLVVLREAILKNKMREAENPVSLNLLSFRGSRLQYSSCFGKMRWKKKLDDCAVCTVRLRTTTTTGGSIITSKVNLEKCNHNNSNCFIVFSTFYIVVSPILRSTDEVGPVEHPSLGWPFGGI